MCKILYQSLYNNLDKNNKKKQFPIACPDMGRHLQQRLLTLVALIVNCQSVVPSNVGDTNNFHKAVNIKIDVKTVAYVAWF